MKDEQIIALYFARNEDAIGETDKKYGARLLQLAQRILLDQFACEEVRSDTYLKTWNAIPPQRPPVFPAFLSRLTRQRGHHEADDLLSRQPFMKEQRAGGVFLARYFYVDPLADVARQYGTSIGAVKSLLYRTRHGLRAHLEQEGFTV